MLTTRIDLAPRAKALAGSAHPRRGLIEGRALGFLTSAARGALPHTDAARFRQPQCAGKWQNRLPFIVGDGQSTCQ
ncbi:MAG: hypothetical protein ACOYOB_10545, partial [Myxococcota bacterium]